MPRTKRAYVRAYPDCYFCKENFFVIPAKYDGKTEFGFWTYMCKEHMRLHGIGLGMGKGQMLIIRK